MMMFSAMSGTVTISNGPPGLNVPLGHPLTSHQCSCRTDELHELRLDARIPASCTGSSAEASVVDVGILRVAESRVRGGSAPGGPPDCRPVSDGHIE